MSDRERELTDLCLRLAERIYLAHEVLANLAEKRKDNEHIQEIPRNEDAVQRQ